MLKKGITKLFFVVFLLYIATPTILVLVDNTVNVSVVHSSSEEGEKHLDIEALFSMIKDNDADLVLTSTRNSLGYFYKKHPKPHLRIISPPPELYIL